jgi:hypothetical protein
MSLLMHSSPRARARIVAVVASLGLGLVGCANNGGDDAIQIVDNVIPTIGCVADPASTTYKSHGTLALDATNPYLFNALLRSRITAPTGQEVQRTIFTTAAEVDITFVGAYANLFSASELKDLQTQGLTKFSTQFAAPILPGGTATGQYTLVPIGLLTAIQTKLAASPPVPTSVRIDLTTTTTVTGTLAGGAVTSQPFVYPITLCNDCVVMNAGTCGMLPAGLVVRPGDACNYFQDGPVDCCMTTGTPSRLQCPGA